ncbi:hypothetical protein DYB32_006029 [Aphanomyces invadans]|uniref:Uncharacterized protein n=1 Tax=Aphanomyces invadans TaxID=157072 RepID=A0A3R7A7D4_9STRA|nr:hypothetical protein DYB32_006029 [Aphanomyces invadans]
MWATWAYVLLPPAVVLYDPTHGRNVPDQSLLRRLLLLTIPFPKFIAKGIVRMNEFLFSLELGGIPIISIITFFAFIALAGMVASCISLWMTPRYPGIGQTYDLQKRYTKTIPGIEKHYEADLQQKASRWRSERNWWISALTFTIYWMLMAFQPVAKGVVRMNEFILNFHIASIPVFSVITGLAFVALAGSLSPGSLSQQVIMCTGQTYDLQKRYNYQITGIEKHYEADLQHRATRWRSERNWWISALTFTIYWMLMAFQSMKKQLLLASRRTD